MQIFTRQERWTLLALAAALVAGMGIDFYQRHFAPSRLHKQPAEIEVSLEKERVELIQHQLIPLNQATQEQLLQLPGIGPYLADEILAYRREHGHFTTLEELQKVPGIGPATFKKIRSSLTLND